MEGDIASVSEFIRLYLVRNERWASPLFLVGESYGTTRAAGLSGYLVEKGIAFNGILLVSSILNFQTAQFTKGNDLPVPALPPDVRGDGLVSQEAPRGPAGEAPSRRPRRGREVRRSRLSDRARKGDALTPAERKTIAERLARFTGLDPAWIDRADLRIEIQHFCKELLRNERRTVGRLDTRFVGIDKSAVSERPDFDPSLAAIRPPYTAMFNQYARAVLGYKSDAHVPHPRRRHRAVGLGRDGTRFADTSEALRQAFAKNPDMKLFVASGHFDLATPYFATQYTLAHLGLDPSQRARITTHEYEAGHMMYIHPGELAKLRKDVGAFLKAALGPS